MGFNLGFSGVILMLSVLQQSAPAASQFNGAFSQAYAGPGGAISSTYAGNAFQQALAGFGQAISSSISSSYSSSNVNTNTNINNNNNNNNNVVGRGTTMAASPGTSILRSGNTVMYAGPNGAYII